MTRIRGTVRAYWRRCLQKARPVLYDVNWVEGETYRPALIRPDATWPRAIRRSVLFHDYKQWCDRAGMIDVETEITFYQSMAPLLYIAHKGKQVRRYMTKTQQRAYEGNWVTIRQKVNFIRLCTLPCHIAAFEILTHEAVGNVIAKDRIALQAGISAFLDDVEVRRKQMLTHLLRGELDT